MTKKEFFKQLIAQPWVQWFNGGGEFYRFSLRAGKLRLSEVVDNNRFGHPPRQHVLSKIELRAADVLMEFAGGFTVHWPYAPTVETEIGLKHTTVARFNQALAEAKAYTKRRDSFKLE
ncbi:MAG: hypothetical protein Q8K86_09530 [Candidatus Nanopelagicaceae bacterium]|nr:hypothetical protein [Candidatus Nanopelagicaceae bacterium]